MVNPAAAAASDPGPAASTPNTPDPSTATLNTTKCHSPGIADVGASTDPMASSEYANFTPL